MSLSDSKLKEKADVAMTSLLHEKGYISAVEVLLKLSYLSKEDYENWRQGRIDYLERVCKLNLSKLSTLNHEIRSFAVKHDLKTSIYDYKREGHQLRFSKSGDYKIEKYYASHYYSKQSNARDGKEDE